jgi:hypothetical protein
MPEVEKFVEKFVLEEMTFLKGAFEEKVYTIIEKLKDTTIMSLEDRLAKLESEFSILPIEMSSVKEKVDMLEENVMSSIRLLQVEKKRRFS